MLISQIKRIIASDNWLNYDAPFFFENAKYLGRSDDAKWRKKGDGLLASYFVKGKSKLNWKF